MKLSVDATLLLVERRMRTSFIPYFGLEGLGALELDNEEDETVLRSPSPSASQLTSLVTGT